MGRCCTERGLHLVAQIADIAATKFERQITAATNDRCFEPRLQRCEVARGGRVRRSICRAVGQHGPLRVAHEGEARRLSLGGLTIEPKAVVAIGIQTQENVFGNEIRPCQPPRESLELDAIPSGPALLDSRGKSRLSDRVRRDRLKSARRNPLPGMSIGLIPKVGDDPHAVLRQDRFGMKLDAPLWKAHMPQSHDQAAFGSSRDYQLIGKRPRTDDE